MICIMSKPGIDVKKSVVVTLSSDKGLCGGINSTVVKVSRALYKLNAGMFIDDFYGFCLFISF